ncbi:MAG: hypothetical protein SF053_18140 [Bacteroidia bacterium]|nr:hypothetical protein [Bacteroidia bacterium]
MKPTHTLSREALITGILAGILVAGILIYVLFMMGRAHTSLDPGSTAFALEDTTAAHRIVLSRVVEGQATSRIEIIRTPDGGWVMPDGRAVFQPRVKHLLRTMSLIHVKEVLVAEGIVTGKVLLDVVHTAVTVYDDRGRKLRDIQVGTETKDSRGTLMMMAGESRPYIVEIPGHQGYINAFFPTDITLWIENLLFDGTLDRLASVRITYPATPDSNLVMTRTASGWMVAGGQADSTRLQAYLGLFQGKVYAESFAAGDYPGKFKALQAVTPDVQVELQYQDGSQRGFVLFSRDDNPNNYFGWITGENNLLTVQHFVVDKYLRSGRSLLREMTTGAI